MPTVFNAVIYYLGNSIHTLSKKTHTVMNAQGYSLVLTENSG